MTQCLYCGKSLAEVAAKKGERRQVFDLPPLELEVTEYQCESKCCPNCKKTSHGAFPAEVKHLVQYGPRIKATLVYLNQYQLIPFERTTEIVKDLFSHNLSAGTVVNCTAECFEKLEESEQAIKAGLKQSAVVHFDETGMRVASTTQWLHSASTKELTHFGIHQKRGSEAMDVIGIIPGFQGIAVHDHWKPYFRYDCLHALCNAHHLRELTFIYEELGQSWAKEMSDLLIETKKAVDASATNSLLDDPEKKSDIEKRFNEILNRGMLENPQTTSLPENVSKKRGRKKQSKPKNLLDRLCNYRHQTMAFANHPAVPFDNNQGERDIRMNKVKQKISGSFRSEKGAQIFCRTRGYLSTIRKNGTNVMNALVSVISGIPLLPDSLLQPADP